MVKKKRWGDQGYPGSDSVRQLCDVGEPNVGAPWNTDRESPTIHPTYYEWLAEDKIQNTYWVVRSGET